MLSPTYAHERQKSSKVAGRLAELELFGCLVRDRDGPARAELLELFMPLARHVARRYRDRDDRDDLEQVAAIGLLKAIDRFDPARGLAFTTFAFPTIMGELRHHVTEPGFARVEDAVILDDLMLILTERERLILTLRFSEDRLQSQIAEATGVSQMHVSRLIRNAIEQLRSAAMSGDGLAEAP